MSNASSAEWLFIDHPDFWSELVCLEQLTGWASPYHTASSLKYYQQRPLDDGNTLQDCSFVFQWKGETVAAFIGALVTVNYIDIKKQVLKVYSAEMHQTPHSRSIDNAIRLNAVRGNSIGVDYAEAFVLIRMIQ